MAAYRNRSAAEVGGRSDLLRRLAHIQNLLEDLRTTQASQGYRSTIEHVAGDLRILESWVASDLAKEGR